MNDVITRFHQYPSSVKNGIILFVAGWLTTFLFLYRLFVVRENDTDYIWRVVVLGIAACFFVVRIRNWARKMCLFLNIGIIVIYSILAYVLYQSGYIEGVVTLALSAVLFALSSYYLLKKETAQFYGLYDPRKIAARQEKEGNH